MAPLHSMHHIHTFFETSNMHIALKGAWKHSALCVHSAAHNALLFTSLNDQERLLTWRSSAVQQCIYQQIFEHLLPPPPPPPLTPNAAAYSSSASAPTEICCPQQKQFPPLSLMNLPGGVGGGRPQGPASDIKCCRLLQHLLPLRSAAHNRSPSPCQAWSLMNRL